MDVIPYQTKGFETFWSLFILFYFVCVGGGGQ